MTYLQEIKRYKPISKAHEDELKAKLIIGGEIGARAKEQLIQHHLYIAIAEAQKLNLKADRKYYLDNLIQAGNLGLVLGADKFDPYRSTRFKSFAVYYVRRQIIEEMLKLGVIAHIPHNKRVSHLKAIRIINDHLTADISLDALAGKIGLATSTLVNLILAIYSKDVHLESYSLPNDVFDTILTHQVVKNVRNAITTLPKTEATIIRLYFGIDCEAKPLMEICRVLNLSRATVHKYKTTALKRLQFNEKLTQLKSELYEDD